MVVSDEEKKHPWSNPLNRMELYLYDAQCEHIKCTDGLVCAVPGNGKFHWEDLQSCEYPQLLCNFDEDTGISVNFLNVT